MRSMEYFSRASFAPAAPMRSRSSPFLRSRISEIDGASRVETCKSRIIHRTEKAYAIDFWMLRAKLTRQGMILAFSDKKNLSVRSLIQQSGDGLQECERPLARR